MEQSLAFRVASGPRKTLNGRYSGMTETHSIPKLALGQELTEDYNTIIFSHECRKFLFWIVSSGGYYESQYRLQPPEGAELASIFLGWIQNVEFVDCVVRFDIKWAFHVSIR